MLLWNVDFHFRHSLSAGGPGASLALCACGVSHAALFPQESRTFRSNHLCFYLDRTLLSKNFVCKMGTLISTPGTRFPRAGGSLLGAPAGSPMPRFFPQESRAFRSNHLCFYLDRTLLSKNFVCKMGTLISTPGTRFPRAGGSLLGTPAGSPMPRFSRRSLVPSVPITFVFI
ncbi:hypothetical protein ABH916_003939 [Peribacillus frigoritolerans]